MQMKQGLSSYRKPSVLAMKDLQEERVRLKIDKSVDNQSDKPDRIDEEITEEDSSMNTSNNLDPELEKLSPMERHIFRFNWYTREIVPYYKAEVMQVHNIATDEEHTRRILEGD
jgi:hypothetical protein